MSVATLQNGFLASFGPLNGKQNSMENQYDNDRPGDAARAKLEADDLPRPPSPSRPKPPRFLYVLDYEKRFPGRGISWHQPRGSLTQKLDGLSGDNLSMRP